MDSFQFDPLSKGESRESFGGKRSSAPASLTEETPVPVVTNSPQQHSVLEQKMLRFVEDSRAANERSAVLRVGSDRLNIMRALRNAVVSDDVKSQFDDASASFWHEHKDSLAMRI